MGHVESIPATNEAIFACSTALGGIALVHVKLMVNRMACDVLVKASAREVCSNRMSAVVQTLSMAS